jgi:glycine oxidase ThiO
MIIVAGGGIIGLSCAWRLAQRGFQVRLFDAREVAREASWAAAGMLAPGGEIARDSAMARMAIESLRLYPSFVEELSAASGLQIDYQRCGALDLAFDENDAAELDARAEAQAALGIRSERVARGRFYPEDAVVNPRDVNAALKTACERLGVEFHEFEPVLQILGNGTGVRTGAGEYEADGVVLSTGAWGGALWPALPKLTPKRGHLIGYRPAPGLPLDSILRRGHTYLVPRKSGEIVAGSSTEDAGFDRSIDETITAELHARACQLLPELVHAQIASTWNGFRPHIEGETPLIGRIDETNVWAACGHYRNGILLAPVTALMISSDVTRG